MTTKAIDDQRIKQYLELLDQWRASGLDAQTFEQQHQLQPNRLRAWRVHERRWRAHLSGLTYVSGRKANQPNGFVALGLPHTPAPTIRIECTQGSRNATLHWPLHASAACASWLREFFA
jgi:hypothetical protein